jgi:hypothetical protein
MPKPLFTHPRHLVASGVAFFVAVVLLQLTLLARANSSTWDEADHTYAAYMQWTHGDFGLNAEHPPLIKFLAALPLLDMHLTTPPLIDRPYRLQEVKGGKDFVFRNDANAILFRARMATSVITLLLVVLVFLSAQEMFSTTAGFLALGLISFDPTLLAHSALVTTDAGQACFMLATVYAFYRYVLSPSPLRLTLTGIALGLALASKHSAILLVPMLLLLALYEALRRKRSAPSATPTKPSSAIALTIIFAIAIFLLWSTYGFRYAARIEGLPLNPSMEAQLQRVPSHLQAHVLGLVDRFHLLPQSYTYGLAHVLIQSKAFTSFVLDRVYPHPVWFYFPVAMLIKSTLTFLILLVIAIWAIASHRLQAQRAIVYLTLPAVIYMIFAMVGGMNIGVRHVLPIYVFLTILIAGAAAALIQRNRRWLYLFLALLVFQAISVVRTFPAYVAYANEAAGGPANVHLHLSDSSADWGQQLKSVQHYLDANNIHHCWFAYFGQGVADFSYYGIPCQPLITADSLYFDAPLNVPPHIDGPVLISAGVLSGFEFGPGALNPYEQFKSLTPAAVIDYSVFVFNGQFDIPFASALSHTQKAGVLLTAHRAPEALDEARQALALAPDSVTVNATMGKALDANGRPTEARIYYQKTLTLARTIEPQFQRSWIPGLEQRLATKQ